MGEDILLLCIGSILTLIPILLEKLFNYCGRVKFYSKYLYSITTSKKAFVMKNADGTFLNIPMKIEIVNNKNKEILIRNLTLTLFKENVKVADLLQADFTIHEENGLKEKIEYGENSNHSFTVAPKSIKTIKCFFFIKQSDNIMEYDNIKLSYYKNNKQQFYSLTTDLESWKTFKNTPEGWIENKKIKYNTKSSKITR